MSVQTYPARIAAEAAQVPKTITLRRWIDTNVAPLRGNDVRTSGTGYPVGLSRNRVLQFAITQALLKSGVSRAAKAALEFSDCGNAGRAAGELLNTARQFLSLVRTQPRSAILITARAFSIFRTMAQRLS